MTLSPFEVYKIIGNWVADLRSTTAKQGRWKLGDDELGYCCLGRVCVVTKESFSPMHAEPASDEQPKAYEALRELSYYTQLRMSDLVHMNDSLKMNFEQIAYVVNMHLERYYGKFSTEIWETAPRLNSTDD